MRTYKFNKPIIVAFSFILLNLFNSCDGQVKNLEDCRLHYKNALTELNAYYKNNKTSLLQESLANIQESLKCPETRYKSIELKISLLILLKRYQSGYEFIDSLSDNDFNAKFKKKMNHDYFRALEYESKSDTANSSRLLNGIVADIQNYIQNENTPKDSLDLDAYLALFLIKKKVSNMKQIETEIDLLKEKYPNEKDDLEGIKNTIFEKTQFSSPISR